MNGQNLNAGQEKIQDTLLLKKGVGRLKLNPINITMLIDEDNRRCLARSGLGYGLPASKAIQPLIFSPF